MNEVIGAALLLCGSSFVLIASIGIIRMPDLLTRMHSVTKAGTLGFGLVLLGAGFYLGSLEVATKVAIGIAFICMSAPVGAHAIARAAYFVNIRLWTGTLLDELQSKKSDTP
ncbi:MAG: monovalent cation/H(+) antiporter subunit G [Bacteriovoracaceae bacterium]|nr:monovalent cation/H(+) antiporter subunit G [Bacteriovoracaceae bacterium]